MNENPISNQTPAWEPPPPADYSEAEDLPKMPLGATLTNIFFNPSETFLALRGAPRFVAAGLILVLLPIFFQFFSMQRIGADRLVNEQFKANPMTEKMSPEDKKIALERAKDPTMQTVNFGMIALSIVLYLAVGGLIYWGLMNALGGNATYPQALSGWTYSAFPSIFLKITLGLIILAISSVDNLNFDYLTDNFVTSNPAFLFDTKTQPVLHALMKNFDIFQFLSIFLGALALQKIGKVSAAAAWGVSIGFWLLFALIRVGWALAAG